MQARRVRELTCTGKFFAGPSWHRPIAASTSRSPRRRLVATISGTVADYANPRAARRRSGLRMQYRNRPDHVTHDRCYRGAKRPPTRLIQCIIESFSESLLIFVADPITVRSCTNRFRSRRAPVWDYQLTPAAAPLQPPPPQRFWRLVLLAFFFLAHYSA